MLKLLIPFAIGALMMFLLMRGCTPTVQPVDTTKIDSLYKAIAKSKLEHDIDSVIHEQDKRANDSLRKHYEGQLADITTKATNQIVKLTFERNKFRTQMEGRDTVSAIATCERFIFLYDSALTIVAQYQAVVDSLQNNGADRRFLDSTAIKGLNAMVAERDKQIEALQHFLNDALKDNTDLRNALAKSKRGRWILAGLGVLVGGVVGHSIK